MSSMLLLGGTFDPIHNGHLNIAVNVQQHFHFERFIFLPCKIPLLKDNALATPAQRLDMIRLALQDYPNLNFDVDPCEIRRDSPSYMAITLENYRQQLGNAISITLLLGQDAFAKLPHWENWQNLLRLTNILVISRSGYDELNLSDELAQWLKKHENKDKEALFKRPNGVIHRFNAGSYDLSSTAIRQALKKQGYSSQLPSTVMQYIRENHLYTI